MHINPINTNYHQQLTQAKRNSTTPFKPTFGENPTKTLSGIEVAEAIKGYNHILPPKVNPVKVTIPEDIDLRPYEWVARQTCQDIVKRLGKEGQFLNWISDLPQEQLKHLDEIYAKAEKARENGKTDLAVIGIGGSRHTTEALTQLLGVDSKIHFYSSIDPDSFDKFAKGLDLDKTQFLVVSKSGGTLETTNGYENCKKMMQEHLGKKDVSDRFFAITDSSSEKSALRQKVDKGELSDGGIVHDDVGGRFSIFDDATLFTLAYAGVPKDDVVRMLKESTAAQTEFLRFDMENNDALRLALSNVDAKCNGKTQHGVEYFGDKFNGATLWEKQLKNESLKSKISTDTNIGPGYLHYNAERDLDPANKNSFYTFVYQEPKDKTTAGVIEGVTNAYKSQHPVSEVVLKDLSPESIAKFVELKHFETLYTGNMLRRIKGDATHPETPLPEVLQPNVEIYKKEVKSALNKQTE